MRQAQEKEVKGNPTNEETCGPKHLLPCISSSGLDKSAMQQCITSKKEQDSVIVNAFDKSKKIQTYPYSTVDGTQQPQGQSITSLKKALCEAGAKAAC